MPMDMFFQRFDIAADDFYNTPMVHIHIAMDDWLAWQTFAWCYQHGAVTNGIADTSSLVYIVS